MMKKTFLLSTLVVVNALVLHAGDITNFSLKGVALPTGPILDTIEVDGTTHDATNLVNGTMTGVTDTGQVQLMVGSDTSAPSPGAGNRSGMLSDLRLDTAILNINEMVFTFDQAIVNTGSGDIDLVFFDWGAFSSDVFNVTINGTTFTGMATGNVPTGGDFHSESASLTANYFATPSPHDGITTVAELDSMTFGTVKNTSSGGSQGVIGLDLTDFGVLVGGSISQMTITESGSVTVDPSLILGIQAVPEPSSLLMIGLGLASVLLFRHRSRG